MKSFPAPDLLLVVPPFSPSDTNPPLGPYVLKTSLARAGLNMDVADLSIRYLSRFETNPSQPTVRLLGDQHKDRNAISAARAHFSSICPLFEEVPVHLPSCADPLWGMHYSFESIDRAVETACQSSSECRIFVETAFFAEHPCRPLAVGLSIMGPPQLFFALVIARLMKRRWPGVPVLAGGSHVTLLSNRITTDTRYGRDIDLFLPGHCDAQLIEIINRLRSSGSLPSDFGVRAGVPHVDRGPALVTPTLNGRRRARTADFEYYPSFEEKDLRWYDAARLTLPMQLTRGCSFGRCAYCTYPEAEPIPDAVPDWTRAIESISRLINATGVRRVSFKDSLFVANNMCVLARRLAEASIRIDWSATTLLSSALTQGVLVELAASGCRTLEFGLETIDPKGQELFMKPIKLAVAENVVEAAAFAGITVVLNQIFGWPGQSHASAQRQLAWFEAMRAQHPNHLTGSSNLLEVNQGSPMANNPERFGIILRGIAPWAFSYDWNAPPWRCGSMRDTTGTSAATYHLDPVGDKRRG